MLQLEYRV